MRPLSEKARRYALFTAEERRSLNYSTIPARAELWRAAIRMFMSRPILGIGPDNFRIRKWAYMNLPAGDDTILANNIYLEILSGSGLLGLTAFLWLLWEFACLALTHCTPHAGRARRITGFFGVAYLTTLLAHGMVDYFLKFTPMLLLFWITLGILCAESHSPEENRSAHCI